ncbi:MAG TPA: serine/threonine-protein kinase [Gemmatimonadales bacterium]|jgi:serine/threonine-protein kinase
MSGPIDQQFVALQEALLGRYSLERVLGRGGMGTVYLAREVQLDRPVAIKLLHPELSGRPAARLRFLQEARTAARLAHPHIVPIFSVEERNDLVFFVMALVDGETLGARIRRRGALPPAEAEQVLRETAWALGYAHAHGVIHRDITTENILLERHTGRAMLADFGLAGEVDPADDGPTFGTPGYLAPELIRGGRASIATDLYAVGVVGYTALAGRPPFDAESASQLLVKHLVQPVPGLAMLAREASRRLVDAVERCLQKDPDDRPTDMTTFLATLERAPETVSIASPLRNWFSRWERVRPIYAIATPLVAVQVYAMLQAYWASGYSQLLTAAVIQAVLTLTAIPAAIQLIFEMRELRRLRAAGFTIDDIRTAAPHWRAELERNYRHATLRPLVSRVVFDLTIFGGVLLVFNQMVRLLFILHVQRALGGYLSGLYFMSDTIYLATMVGIGISFASPGIRFAPHGRFRRLVEKFWNGKFASKLASFAGTATHGQVGAGETLHRPTEMVLGLAVDDLWTALSPPLRADLGDVPALAATLQSSAVEMRQLIDRLRESERDIVAEPAQASDLAATRDELEGRHRTVIKTLEQLRIHLLRLLATRTHTVELTEHLESARQLEATLIRDIAGHTAVRRVLRPAAVSPTATPTPSPA